MVPRSTAEGRGDVTARAGMRSTRISSSSACVVRPTASKNSTMNLAGSREIAQRSPWPLRMHRAASGRASCTVRA